MSVHVGEIHTEVSTAGGGPPAESSSGPSGKAAPAPPGVAVDRWLQTRAESSRLACRVAAEGFDD